MRLRLAVMFATLLLVLLVTEVATRVLLPPPSFVAGMAWEPELGFQAPQSMVLPYVDELGRFESHYNEDGFRGPTLPVLGEPRPAGEERLLVLGDSFVQAYAVRDERILQAVVERKLAAGGRPTQVFSAACDGYGTTQQYLLYRRCRERARPDRVLLVLFTGNDVANNAIELARRTTVSAGDYVRPYLVGDGDDARITYLEPKKAFLRRHSRLFTMVDRALLGKGVFQPLGGEGPRNELTPQERVREGGLPAEHLNVLDATPDERWTTARARTEAIVRHLAREVRADGAELVVGILPSLFQVQRCASMTWMDRALAQEGRGRLADVLDLDAPEAWLTRFLDEEGIVHATCVRELREYVRSTGLSVYREDGHLNGRGHEIAGACMAEALLGVRDEAPFEATGGEQIDLLGVTHAKRYVDYTEDLQEHTVAGPGITLWTVTSADGEDFAGWAPGPEGLILVAPAHAGVLCTRGLLRPVGDGAHEVRVADHRFAPPAERPFWETVRVTSVDDAEREVRFEVLHAEDLLVVLGVALADPVWGLAALEEDLGAYRELVALPLEERIARLEAELPVLSARAAELSRTASALEADAGLASLTELLEAVWNVHRRLDLHAAALPDHDDVPPEVVTPFFELVDRAKGGGGSLAKLALEREGDADAPDAPLARSVARWALALDLPELLVPVESVLADLGTEPELLARVRDRVAARSGLHQPYGTAGVRVGEHWFGPDTVPEDELRANREALGLEPLEDYRARFPGERIAVD